VHLQFPFSFIMKVTLFFAGCWALIGPQEVNGTVGGSVLVPCQYNEDYQSYRKYWCRGDNWRQCSMDIQTTGSEEEVGQKKLSITDNHTLCIFTVTMKDLQEEDDNTYWCGIERSGYDLMIPVRVFILPGKFLVVLASVGLRSKINMQPCCHAGWGTHNV
uniref:Immunoglobulin domain-containing protein n=1 Tax=Crocodylus porosus TaxID=8502 RepID=A0A7M4E2T0_CROPO